MFENSEDKLLPPTIGLHRFVGPGGALLPTVCNPGHVANSNTDPDWFRAGIVSGEHNDSRHVLPANPDAVFSEESDSLWQRRIERLERAIEVIAFHIAKRLADVERRAKQKELAKLNAELAKQSGQQPIKVIGLFDSNMRSRKGDRRSRVVLAQSGDEIRGRFIPDSGAVISGRITSANRIQFRLTFASGFRREGSWEVLDGKRSHLKGIWADQGNATGTWELVKAAPGSLEDIAGLEFESGQGAARDVGVNLAGTDRFKETGTCKNKNTIQIVQTGNRITGSSEARNLEIEGTINEDKVLIDWYSTSNKGKARLTIDESGNLAGNYWGDSWGKGKGTFTKSE